MFLGKKMNYEYKNDLILNLYYQYIFERFLVVKKKIINKNTARNIN